MNYHITIIGGGIVGLATAYKLLGINPDLKLLLLEKEEAPARHQTGNNSGVIHSGIYYKPGSLKAKNCIDGYQQLLNFCESFSIPYEKCGKIIVATHHLEIPRLKSLLDRGHQNGLEGLKFLTKDELHEIEPHVSGLAGIFVPQTGIVDYRSVSETLLKEIIRNGAVIHFNEKVVNIKKENAGMTVTSQTHEYRTNMVINCAGLYSDKIARLTRPDITVRIIPFRGEYFKLKKDKSFLVKNLIYPVPDPEFPFLGVHFTRMINGDVEAGPNAVLAFSREGYKKSQINPVELYQTLTWPGFIKIAGKYWKTGIGEMARSFSKTLFTRALQKLIPEIQEQDLIPGGAGVRAQACDRNGGLLDDFLIYEDKNVINVCNAPSPAATSALSIGEKIAGISLNQLFSN